MAELRAAVDEAARGAAARADRARRGQGVHRRRRRPRVRGPGHPEPRTRSPARCSSWPTRSRTCRFPRSPWCTGCVSPPGLEVSLACDLLWASEGARFGLVEKVVGITPLMGGTQRMAERAGTARAREFVYSGALYDAPTLALVGRGQPRARGGRPARGRARVRGRAGRRSDRRARRHEGDRARAGRPRHARRRRAHRSLTSHLFETHDSRNAVQTFLQEGPGKATFTGK